MNVAYDIQEVDGFVYDDKGNRVRKWFKLVDGYRVWMPKMTDVHQLERLRMKMMLYMKRRLWPRWHEIVEDLKRVKAAYAPHKDGYIRYSLTEDGDIVSDIIDKPQEPMYMSIGIDFKRIGEKIDTMARHLAFVDKLLLMAIAERVGRPNRIGDRLRVLINGRDYWIHGVQPNNGQLLVWEQLSWPGDQEKVVEV
jgi:hypothetical protein